MESMQGEVEVLFTYVTYCHLACFYRRLWLVYDDNRCLCVVVDVSEVAVGGC